MCDELLQTLSSHIADDVLLAQQRAEIVLAEKLHQELQASRRRATATDAVTFALLAREWDDITRPTTQASLCDEAAADLAGEPARFPVDIQFLLKSFLRLLQTVRAQRCTAGLLQLVHAVPSVVGNMPPRALAAPHGHAHEGVVEAVGDAIEALVRDRATLSPGDVAAVYTAAVALAIKRASLPHLLSVVHHLLAIDDGDGPVCEGKGNRDDDLLLGVAPFLGELKGFSPLRRRDIEAATYEKHETGASDLLEQLRAAEKNKGGKRDFVRSPNALEPGWLMTFGRADHGKLCHGNVVDSRAIPTFAKALQSVELMDLDSLSTHSLAITKRRELLVWGRSDAADQQPEDEVNGQVVPGNEAAGRNDVWPRFVVPLAGRLASRVACGLGHVLVQLSGGEVYSWGNGGNGRLGLGDAANRTVATKVACLGSIVYIACGASHSLAIAETGTPYAWGKNSEGQCGVGTRDDVLSPLCIAGINGPTLMLVGGWEHTLALRRDGTVFSFGSGYHDARRGAVPPVLGHGNTDRQLAPKRVELLASECVTHVACGWDHSLAVTNNGVLYTWGSGTHGKLGHNDERSRDVPTSVAKLAQHRVVLAGGGCEHSAAITSCGELYTWGQSDGGRLGLSLPVGAESGVGPSELSPRRVKTLVWKHLRATGLSVGDKYTMILVRSRDDKPSPDWQQETFVVPNSTGFHRGHQAKQPASTTRFDGTWLRAQPALQIRENQSIHSTQTALIVLTQLERHATRFLPEAPFCYHPEILMNDPIFRHHIGTPPSLNSVRADDRPSVTTEQQNAITPPNSKSNNLDDNDNDEDQQSCFGGDDGRNDQDSPPPPVHERRENHSSASATMFSPSTWPYAVDVSLKTFNAFASLLDCYVDRLEIEQNPPTKPIVDMTRLRKDLAQASSHVSLSTKTIAWIVLWCSLRILQANIFWLSMRATTFGAVTRRQRDDLPNVFGVCSTTATANRDAGVTSELDYATGATSTAVDDSPEVQALIWNCFATKETSTLDVLTHIHAIILRILASARRPHVDALSEHLHLEAAEVLKIGFPHFYPSLSSRVSLLRSLVAGTYSDNKLLFGIFVDLITQNDHISSLIVSVLDPTTSAPSSVEPPCMNKTDLSTMLLQLFERCVVKPCVLHDKTNGSRQTKHMEQLLLTLQNGLISFWAEASIARKSHSVQESPRVTPLQEVALGHTECVLLEASRLLDGCTESVGVLASRTCILRAIVMPLVSFLGVAFDTDIAVTMSALHAATHLLPTVLALVMKLDSINVSLRVSPIPETSSSAQEAIDWLHDFEADVAFTAARLTVTFSKKSHEADHRSESPFSSPTFWLDTSKIFTLGAENWPKHLCSSSDDRKSENNPNCSLRKIASTIQSWMSQGLYSKMEHKKEDPDDSSRAQSDLSTSSSATSLGKKLRLGSLQGDSLEHLDSFLIDLVQGRRGSVASALDEWVVAYPKPGTDTLPIPQMQLARPNTGSLGRVLEPVHAIDEVAIKRDITAAQGLESVRHALLAIILKSSGRKITEDALRLGRVAFGSNGRNDVGVTIPHVISSVWRTAEHGVEVLVSHLLKPQFGDKFANVCGTLGKRAVENAEFLLGAKWIPPVELIAIDPASHRISPAEHLRKWSRENPRSDWHELQRLVTVLSDWQLAQRSVLNEPWLAGAFESASSRECKHHDMIDLMTNLRKVDLASEPTHLVSCDAPIQLAELVRFLVTPISRPAFFEAMHSRKLRARVRAASADILHHLLYTLGVAAPKREVIAVLGRVMSIRAIPSNSNGYGTKNQSYYSHFLDDLSGAGPAAIGAVQDSVSRLYSLLAHFLDNSLESNPHTEISAVNDPKIIDNHAAMQLALIQAQAIKLLPRSPLLHVNSQSPKFEAKMIADFFLFDSLPVIIHALGNLLGKSADILAFPHSHIIRLCVGRLEPWFPWDRVDPRQSVRTNCNDQDRETRHNLSSSALYPRHAINHASWLTLRLLAIQLCVVQMCETPARDATAFESRMSASKPAALCLTYEAAVTALFDVMLVEVTRVHDRLEELLRLKSRFVRAHSRADSALLFGGILALGTESRVSIDIGELSSRNSYSLCFWVWLPERPYADNNAASRRYACVTSSTIEHPSKKSWMSDRQWAHPRVVLGYDPESGWYVEFHMVVTKASDKATEEESQHSAQGNASGMVDLPCIRSNRVLPTNAWVHVCCTLSVCHAHNVDGEQKSRATAFTSQLYVNTTLAATESVTVLRYLKIACRELVVGGPLTALSTDATALNALIADVGWHCCVLQADAIEDLYAGDIQGIRQAHHAQVGAYAFNLIVLLDHLSQTSTGIACLTASPWPTLLTKMLRVSGTSAQFHILRMLRTLAGPTAPDFLLSLREASKPKVDDNGDDSISALAQAAGSGANLASALRRSAAHSVIEQLCRLLGEASFPVNKHNEALALPFAQSEPHPVFCSTLAAAPVVEVFGACDQEVPRCSHLHNGDGENLTWSLGCGVGGSARLQLVDTDHHSLVSEIVMLLRWLLRAPGWREPMVACFGAALSETPSILKNLDADTTNEASQCQKGALVAALHVMGGHIEGPRIGMRVVIPAGLEAVLSSCKYRFYRASRGTVIHFSTTYGKAFVYVDENDLENVLLMHEPNAFESTDPFRMRDGLAGVGLVLPLSELTCELEVREEAGMASLPESAISGIGELIRHEPHFANDNHVASDSMECESDMLANCEEKIADRRQTTRVLCGCHLRCHALRAIARQANFATCAFSFVVADFLRPLLSQASIDIATVPTTIFGDKTMSTLQKSTIDTFLMKFCGAPSGYSAEGSSKRSSNVEQRSAKKLSPTDIIAELERFAQAAWSRFSGLAVPVRMPWQHESQRKVQQGLEAIAGDVSIDGHRVCAVRHFPSVRLKGVSLYGGDLSSDARSELVAGGRWYYEVVLLTDGLMQIGWADVGFVCDPVRGQGVGDHTHSWAIDGFRQKRWCLNSANYGERWQTGDVLGALLDLNLYEMRFFLNGRDLGVAFRGFRAQGLYPAASLNDGQAAHFNFGPSQFMHPPSGIDGLPFRAVADATQTVRSHSQGSQRSHSRGSQADLVSCLDGTTPLEGTNAVAGNQAGDQQFLNVVPASTEPAASSGPSGAELAVLRARGAVASTEEDIMAEIELRQQHLIENLIGMGFPVEWAIRASESCDVTLNESVAIAWIIERMGEENEKVDDIDNYNANYNDDGEDYEADGADVGDSTAGLASDAFSSDRYHLDEYYHHCANAAAAAAAAASGGSNAANDKDTGYGEFGQDTGGGAASSGDRMPAQLQHDGEMGCDSLYDRVYFPSLPHVSESSVPKLALDSEDDRGHQIEYREYTHFAQSAVFDSVSSFIGDVNNDELAILVVITYGMLAVLYARAACMNVFSHIEVQQDQRVEHPERPLVVHSASSRRLLVPLADAIVIALCKQDSYSSLIKLLKLVIFRAAVPPSSFEADMCTPSQWRLLNLGLSCINKWCDPRLHVHIHFAQYVGLHPLECIATGHKLLTYFAFYRHQSGESYDDSSEVYQTVIPTILSLVVDEAVSSLESANHHDYDHVDWNDMRQCQQTDYEALALPNVRWATWTLETMMSLAEDLLSIGELRVAQDSAIVSGLFEVFSAGLFGSLLDTARNSNNTLRETAFRLCARILCAIGIFIDKSESAGQVASSLLPSLPENFISIMRERQLFGMFSSQLRKEITSRVLFSPYLQSLMSMLLQWRLVHRAITANEASENDEIGLAEEDPAVCSWQMDYESVKSRAEGDSTLELTIEEITATSVSLSWGGCDYPSNDEPPAGQGNIGEGKHCGVRYSLQSSIASSFGSEPLAEVACDLNANGFFVLDGLNADTCYRLRLARVKLQGYCSVPAPAPGPATILKDDEAHAWEASLSVFEDEARVPDNNKSSPAGGASVAFGSIVTVVTMREILLKLNPAASGPNLVLSNDNATVTNRQNKKWNACLATTGFSSGAHSWEVRVDRCVSKNIFIGVARAESTMENYIGSDCHGWGYLANKAIWHNKGKIRSYGELFKEGDTIGVHLDMDAGNLWFSRNGRDLGAAVEGLDGNLYPAFSLYNKGDQLTLLPPEARVGYGNVTATSPMHGTAVAEDIVVRATSALEILQVLPIIPTRAARSKVVVAPEASITSTTRRREEVVPSTLPMAAARKVLHSWKQWKLGFVTRAWASDGRLVTLNTSPAACSSFKMKPGDQIESLRGLATVLGMADHQLWYALDAREKTTRSSSTHVASRWSRRQVFEMRAKPLEYKFLPAPCLEEKGCRESSIDVDDVDLSVATMIAWFEEWTADMDAELVRCMESLAARRGPFALRYDEIDATALQPYPSLVALSLPQVTLRMALLTHLNELLPPILPLLDLSAADSWISATSSSIGGGRESYLPKLDARSLCHAVRANNFRIFPELKHHILARLLAKQTKCDGDNSPSELIPRLTLVVKPTESRSDRKRWIDEEYRLARSQFGQACAQLAAMPLVCRQVVARPAQDERILRGEGDEQECGFHIHVAARKGRAAVQDSVIDRYRDFFDSVCSEVCDDRLFTPTSASPARRYMVNASFSVPATPFAHPVGIDSTRLATYRAFGHLVGVALRTQVPLPKLNFARALWTSLTGLEPTRAELARIDDEVIKVVECLENLDAHGVTSANFDALLGSLDVRFAIPRSHDRAWGNNVIELCDKGRQRRLAFDNVREFAASLLSARAREAAPALAAVRAGIEAVFPRRLLALYTPEDLERAVRGTIDPSKNATVILDTES